MAWFSSEGKSGIKKAQTVTEYLSGEVNPWVITFTDLSRVDYVVLIYQIQNFQYMFDSYSNPNMFNINGNTVSFTHGIDSSTWTILCSAVETY